MPSFGVKEDFFNVFAKDAGDLKRQVESWFVLARFNRIDALPRHTDGFSEFSLRPFLFGSQHTKSCLH